MTYRDTKDEKGVQQNTPEITASFVLMPTTICDPWGVWITSTLLDSLSADERSGLAGHVETCPACAALFEQYQFIEELLKELPSYDVQIDEKTYLLHKEGQKHNDIAVQVKKERRKNKRRGVLASLMGNLVNHVFRESSL